MGKNHDFTGKEPSKNRKAMGVFRRGIAVMTVAGLILTESPVWAAESAVSETQAAELETQELQLEGSEKLQEDHLIQNPEEEIESISDDAMMEDEEMQEPEEEVEEEPEEEIEVEAEETQQAMEAALPVIKVEKLDPATGDFVIRISNVTTGTGENIIVPIWQDDKQADLIWYTAEKEGRDFVVRSNVSGHGYRNGTYKIHVYKRSKNWEMNFLDKITMEVEPSAKSLGVDYTNQSKTTLRLSLKEVSTYGLEKQVEFAVWSDVNGQDDLKWYKAEKKGSNYEVNVPLSNHKGKGRYLIHSYVKTQTDKMICVHRSEYTVAGPAAEKITAVQVEGDKAKLEASGISGFDGIESVQFAVWSVEGGQDDLRWFGQTAVTGASYVKTISMADYKKTGTYNVHAYARDPQGTMILLGTTTMEIQKTATADPACSSFKAEVTGSTSFRLTANGITAPFSFDTNSVVIPTWSASDQSDLVWYQPEKSGDSYVVNADISRHGNRTGTYQSHLYVKDKAGKMYCIGKTSFKIESTSVAVKASLNADQSTATLTLEGHKAPAGMKDVSFAVWSEANGQDDLKWYIAKGSNGTWTCSVDVNAHNSQGKFQVHCYMKTADNKSVFLGSTTFTVTVENRVSVQQKSDDSYVVAIRGASYNGTPAKAVVCPTWSSTNGQDDLVWYDAVKQSDGSFAVTIKRQNHKHDGTYITDIYVKDGSGNQKMVQRVNGQLKMVAATEMSSHALEVMRKIIYAVETGGQVYGRQRYDAFLEAYHTTSSEKAITIGAGCWYATEAKTLLNRIRTEYPQDFRNADTAGIAGDLDTQNWSYYGSNGAGTRTILPGSAKAVAIQNIISSPGGIAVQDALVEEQMAKYADQAKALGVTDVKARLFCANIQHLGGYNAMARVVNYCKTDGVAITMENLWTSMRAREAGSGNKVGSDLYRTRHEKVMKWLNENL